MNTPASRRSELIAIGLESLIDIAGIATGVPIFPKSKEGPPRSGFFEHDEFLAMRTELPEHLKLVITFAYCTGCRKGEILNLRRDQVGLLVKVVRLKSHGGTQPGAGRGTRSELSWPSGDGKRALCSIATIS